MLFLFWLLLSVFGSPREQRERRAKSNARKRLEPRALLNHDNNAAMPPGVQSPKAPSPDAGIANTNTNTDANTEGGSSEEGRRSPPRRRVVGLSSATPARTRVHTARYGRAKADQCRLPATREAQESDQPGRRTWMGVQRERALAGSLGGPSNAKPPEGRTV